MRSRGKAVIVSVVVDASKFARSRVLGINIVSGASDLTSIKHSLSFILICTMRAINRAFHLPRLSVTPYVYHVFACILCACSVDLAAIHNLNDLSACSYASKY